MDNDDQPIGKVLNRREFLALLGTASAAWLASCLPAQATSAPTAIAPTQAPAATLAAASATPTTATTTAVATTVANAAATTAPLPTCIVLPEMTEGPYFVDEKLNRSDIRSDPSDNSVREGAEFQLAFRVSQVGGSGCTPLAEAMVDIWHCDAHGVYSGVEGASGTKFLRGYQMTDANGVAQFITIYPGWYPGRTVHIHFKIRLLNGANAAYDFTSQLFFDDAFTDTVYAQAPYTSRGTRNTRNERDGIYGNGGDQLTLNVTQSGNVYTAIFDIGLQL